MASCFLAGIFDFKAMAFFIFNMLFVRSPAMIEGSTPESVSVSLSAEMFLPESISALIIVTHYSEMLPTLLSCMPAS